jgi:hypothetical protein
MGTTLTGTTPQDTYDSLIKVTDNGPISATAKYLSDGLGNDSALALSTSVVGINTSSPNTNYPLSIASASNANAIAVFGRASDNTGSIDFYQSNGSSRILEFGVSTTQVDIYNDLNTPMLFSTNATERMRITGTGNVGIGTSTPLQKLGIDGSIVLQSSDAAFKSLIFRSPSSNWGPQNSRIDFIPADGVNAAVDISLNLWNGNGATPETLRFPSSGGIQFPATQISSANANTLDDYEEGTWTMGVEFGGAAVGVTTSSNTGTFTKIGRQVTVNGYLALTSKGSSTGTAKLTGLPFTVGAGVQNFAPASLRIESITFVNQFQALGAVGSTNIELEEVTTLGVNGVLTDVDFANNSTIMLSLTYFV